MQLSLNASQAHLLKLRGDAFIVRDDSGNIALCRNVEQVAYADQTVVVSAAPLFGNVDLTLTQVYVAGFNRAPETGGYNYWLQQSAATGLIAVADTIFSLDIVKAIYPAAMAADQFVTAIYQNVFDRAPDSEGLAYWVGQLGLKSRGQLVIDISTAALNTPDGTAGKDYFQNRVDWALYAVGYQAREQSELTPTHLTTLTDGVNADPLTVITLVGQAEAGIGI